MEVKSRHWMDGDKFPNIPVNFECALICNYGRIMELTILLLKYVIFISYLQELRFFLRIFYVIRADALNMAMRNEKKTSFVCGKCGELFSSRYKRDNHNRDMHQMIATLTINQGKLLKQTERMKD